jgi:hypothetical protein
VVIAALNEMRTSITMNNNTMNNYTEKWVDVNKNGFFLKGSKIKNKYWSSESSA